MMDAPERHDDDEYEQAEQAAQLVWGDAQEGQPPVDHEQLASAPVATQPTMGEEDISEDGEAHCEAMLEKLRVKYTTRNVITVRNRKIWQKRGEREAKGGMDPFALMQKMHGKINVMEDDSEKEMQTKQYNMINTLFQSARKSKQLRAGLLKAKKRVADRS